MSASSQNFVKIQAIRDGVIFTGPTAIRAVLLASSLNFALKSQEERDAIIYSFQEFLNSLGFYIEILVSSRKVDIDDYLEELSLIQKRQENEQMRFQIEEYIGFIKSLTENANIMVKNFYIIVPYSTVETEKKGFIKTFFKRKQIGVEITDENFAQFKTQLWERVDLVATGLKKIGINAVPLNTQEIIELFYNFYNPEKKIKKHLGPIGKMEIRLQ